MQRDWLQKLQQRTWSLADFRSRYLDHPLVGALARRLICDITDDGRDQAAIQHEGQLVDASGRALDALTEAARVSLWHPHMSTAAGVRLVRLAGRRTRFASRSNRPTAKCTC